mmetsp:Transcript_47585/g.151870  ORF Transcript_47585/g.151870 Transcript_47585/m.151870 type:complete len:229 (+) Transcript_47585:1022-1708(+)
MASVDVAEASRSVEDGVLPRQWAGLSVRTTSMACRRPALAALSMACPRPSQAAGPLASSAPAPLATALACSAPALDALDGTAPATSRSAIAAAASSWAASSWRNQNQRAAVLSASPAATGASMALAKPRKVMSGLREAMSAFCGFPMIVRLLPMFELMLTASRNGNLFRTSRLLQRSNTAGVSTKQVVSLSSTADMAAEQRQTLTSMATGEASSMHWPTCCQTPVSFK